MFIKPNNISRVLPLTFGLCCLLVCISGPDCAGQTTNGLPRVATIKNYPATGLMTGCGNLYFFPTSHATSSATDYVFLARGDGSNAWMNLGGRDVRLHQIKRSTRAIRQNKSYEYRLGKLRISVAIENFKPAKEPVSEGDSMFKMKITLRKGRAVRIVRAIGDSDC